MRHGRLHPTEGAATRLYSKVAVSSNGHVVGFLVELKTTASDSVESRPSLPAQHQGTSLWHHYQGHLPWTTAWRRWPTERAPTPKRRPMPYFLLISYKLRVEGVIIRTSKKWASEDPSTRQNSGEEDKSLITNGVYNAIVPIFLEIVFRRFSHKYTKCKELRHLHRFKTAYKGQLYLGIKHLSRKVLASEFLVGYPSAN